jgi:aspartate racemase
LNQLDPESSAYNESNLFRISGPLNINALTQALNAIIARHEALRTTIGNVDGTPSQQIATNRELEVPVIDLRSWPKDSREIEAQRLITESVRRPFDLSRDLMVRVLLVRLAEEQHIFLVAKHHIASDGWSSRIFRRELAMLYEAFSKGETPILPELPIQYADYAVWQRDWLQGDNLEAQLSYWRKQLADVPLLKLPTDRPRPTVQSHGGATHSFDLSEDLSNRLKTLSRQENATLFMTLLAAFQTLLYRYTGQDDISVGTPIAGRTRPETEGLIGFFVNTLVMRTELSGNPTFRELLTRVRKVALEAYDNQDIPFEKLVQELNPDRSLSHTPLFQVMFAYQNLPQRVIQIPGLAVTPVNLEKQVTKFDMYLRLQDDEQGGLAGSIEYNTDIYNPAMIVRMAVHLEILLEGIVDDPEQRISSLPLLPRAEKHQLLLEWNATRTERLSDKNIGLLFDEQARKTPDAVAVVFKNQLLTYRELNTKANQLAHYLKKLGAGPDVLVGISVERSLDMIVGLLGILKAGGAYVPLDPSYPNERIAFMLQDSQVSLLLTQEHLLDHLPHDGTQIICLDRDWHEISSESESDPNIRISADDLAYVIYTSGSTGKPKGVAIPHWGIIRLLFRVDYVKLNGEQIFLQLAPLSFDASTFEIWGALLHGAKCVLYPGSVPTPTQLAEFLHKHGINTLWLTAALYNAVIEEAPQALLGVNQLLIGGEALSVTHVMRGLALLPNTQIINGYGPTESTTFTCCYPIPRDLIDQPVTSIPIGRPIGNTQVYILDQHRNPVPFGVTGELYIGGDGLARGYLNRRELTAEKFIANPFCNEAGSRLYRTGDLARYLADGNIEFLGRDDDQVKIRGYRIEPGEVNAVLNAHSGVKASHVLALRQRSGDVGLTAYYVEDNTAGNPPTAGELRGFLAERLPNYMIPVSFVSVPKIPLTPNGKVDHQALLDSQCQETQNRHEYVAPRDETETILCKLWGEILKLDRVGIDDDFFAIGGHSLLAAKLFSRVDEYFGRSLPLGVLFAAPTVRALADRYRASVGQKTRALIALREAGSLPPVFAVPGVFGNVVGFAELCRELGPGQPFYGLQSVGLDGSEPPLSSIEEMAVLYISEICAVQPHGPYTLLGACFGATVAYEMAHQFLDEGEEVAFLGLLDPTPREGNDLRDPRSARLRAIGRAAALASWVLGRLYLYEEEARHLSGSQRLRFLLRKFISLTGIVKNPNRLKAARRELIQLEVYRANLAALDRYQRKPLSGRLGAVEVFHTARLSRRTGKDPLNWDILWKGSTARHLLPGKDSGDLLTGGNVKILAALLAQRLAESRQGQSM